MAQAQSVLKRITEIQEASGDMDLEELMMALSVVLKSEGWSAHRDEDRCRSRAERLRLSRIVSP